MEIYKSDRLNHVDYAIRGPLAQEATKMELDGHEIIRLNIGNPGMFGFNTPDEIIEDMILNLRNAQGYSESKGIFFARKAIMQYYQLQNIFVSPEDIFIGNGVSELIIIAMQALLNKGDEMLIPSPDYPLWTAAVNLAEANAVHYLCDEQSDWMPDIEDIKKKITPKTKGLVIINPNNPTGAVYSKDVLLELIKIAHQHHLVIFSDEIYSRLIMDEYKHCSIAALDNELVIVTLDGLSKSHLIAGFRVGWLIISGKTNQCKDFIDGINTLASMRLCSNVPAQYIVQTALGGIQRGNSLLQPKGRIYEQREIVYNALAEMDGLSCVKPKAAFYAFPKIDTQKYNISDDVKFALDLLHKEKVLIIPGSGFNWSLPDHFRIVTLANKDILEAALAKIKSFLENYDQNKNRC